MRFAESSPNTREWMIRGYAIGLAVATIRPIMATFFAAALLQGHAPEPKEFFGTAFWIGFTLQTIAAEIWINYTKVDCRGSPGDASRKVAAAC